MRSLAAVRALVLVEETGSYTRAAEALGVTQSAVSQHIAGLERLVGQPLVEPRTRPVELTVAGRVLADHGRAAVGRLAAAERDLAELGQARESRIRLGSFPTALATFVPRAVRRVRLHHPNVVVTLVDEHMPGLWRRLEQRDVDLAVVFAPPGAPDPEGFVITPLFTDAYKILLPRGHRLLDGGRPLGLHELAAETWVGAGAASTWFRIVVQECRRQGFDPRVGLVSDDHVAVQAFVQSGIGVAVVPGLAALRPVPGVEVRSIAGSPPTRAIAVAYPDGPFVPRGVTAMVEAMVTITAEGAGGVRAPGAS